MTGPQLIANGLFPAGLALSMVWAVFVGHAHAASAVQQDWQLWTPVSLTVSLPHKLTGSFEVHPRVGNEATNLNQLLLRPALGYQLTKHVSLGQGYSWMMNDQPPFRDEHRLSQQLRYTQAFPHWTVLSRARLEERFLEDTDGIALRARALLRGTLPLGETNRWALVLSDELFINLNSLRPGPAAGFDQNRFFAGVNQRVQDHMNITIGYQLQLLNTPASRFVDIMRHNLVVQTNLTFGVTPPNPLR